MPLPLAAAPVRVGRPLQDIVDEIGFGWAQWRLILLAGGVYFVQGELATMLSLMPAAIAKELGLHPYQRASFMSMLVLGMLAGNSSNVFSDRYLGRRTPIIISYVGNTIVPATMTLFSSYWPILCCYFTIGCLLGFALPSWNSLCAENCPRSSRMFMQGASQMLFNYANLQVLFMVILFAPDLVSLSGSWRRILLFGRVQSACLLILAFCPGFVSSARWALARGDIAGATEVLATMRSQNGCRHVDIELERRVELPDAAVHGFQWADIGVFLGPRLRCTTLVCMLSTFTLNFLSYGLAYSLPFTVPRLNLGMAPAVFLFVSSFTEICGMICAIVGRMDRKRMFVVYLWFTALGIVSLISSILLLRWKMQVDFAAALVPCSLLAMAFFMAIGWIVVYTYISEVFPTTCRSSATGFCMSVGRLGSFLSPFCFEYISLVTGQYFVHYAVAGAFLMINAVSASIFIPETRDKALEDTVCEATPLKGIGSR